MPAWMRIGGLPGITPPAFLPAEQVRLRLLVWPWLTVKEEGITSSRVIPKWFWFNFNKKSYNIKTQSA